MRSWAALGVLFIAAHPLAVQGGRVTTVHSIQELRPEAFDEAPASNAVDAQPKQRDRRQRYARVIGPAVFFAIMGSVALVALKHSASDADLTLEEKRKSTECHPLMKKVNVSTVARVLHMETTFAEDFRAAVTVPRLVTFCLAISLSILISLTETTAFKTTTKVNDVPDMPTCSWHCHETQNAVCDKVNFKEEYCDKHGLCAASVAKLAKETKVEPFDLDKDWARHGRCSFPVAPEGWKIDLVLISLVMGIYLIVDGCTTEMILFGMCCIYAAFGVISTREAFDGFASSSVVGLATLFPIAAAVEETGVLDAAIGTLLGNPSNLYVALFRMMLPVAFLSAFLSNTAIVAMMCPIVVSWSRRLNTSPSKLLMPLSFAAQLGGSATLVGSSHCLVAKESVNMDVYTMQFFDLAPAGVAICSITFVFIALCLPLLSSSAEGSSAGASELAPEEAAHEANAAPASSSQGFYVLTLSVRSGGSFDDMERSEACMQLSRLPGVAKVKELQDVEARHLAPGDRLRCEALDAGGVVALRRLKGLALENEADVLKLGMEREHRHCYEVVLSSDSALVGAPLDAGAMRQVLGACPLALRGRSTLESPAAGDILLLEADERYVNNKVWQSEFSVTCKIPNSSPLRVGGVHDRARCVLVCLGMAGLITLITFELVNLAVGGGIFVLVLVLSNAYQMSAIYSVIKAPVLLTIAGASGLSAALKATGVALYASNQLKEVAMGFGPLGIRAAVYFISVFLSMFMNNSATVAIIGPMLYSMLLEGQDAEQGLRGLTYVMVFAAGTCLTTPLGYQTNLMVMKDGGYAFGDFMKYGSIIQLLHMITTLACVHFVVDVLDM